MATLTLTLIGQDRAGLVRALAARVAAAGGNWLEARMARLAGQFAGIVLIEVADAEADGLVAELRRLEADSLDIAVARGVAEEATAALRPTLTLSLVGQDHPGIVRDITETLAGQGVNIVELTTDTATAPFSGERLFRATVRLTAPGEAIGPLRTALEALAQELMVDVELVEADTARA